MQILSNNEVYERAVEIYLDGAESMWEDWFDENGEFTEEDEQRVYEELKIIHRELRRQFEQDRIEDTPLVQRPMQEHEAWIGNPKYEGQWQLTGDHFEVMWRGSDPYGSFHIRERVT